MLAFLALMAVVPVACTSDPRPMRDDGFEPGVPVTIKVGTSRADEDGEAESMLNAGVEGLYVLVYDSKSGDLKFHFPIDVDTTEELAVMTGVYDFVFIANMAPQAWLRDPEVELAYSDGTTRLDIADRGTFDHISKLRAYKASAEAMRLVLDDDAAKVPMISLYDKVRVVGDYDILDRTGISLIGSDDTWFASLARGAVRLDLRISMTEAQFEAWASEKIAYDDAGVEAPYIAIKHNAQHAMALPGIFGDPADNILSLTYRAFAPADPAAAADPVGVQGTIRDDPGEQGIKLVTLECVILPEHLLTPDDNTKGSALLLELNFGGTVKSAPIMLRDNGDYSLPRNSRLVLDVDVAIDRLLTDITVVPWTGIDLLDGAFKQWQFDVDRSIVELEGAIDTTADLKIDADDELGWEIVETVGYTDPVEGDVAFEDWLEVEETPAGLTITVKKENPDTGIPREGRIVIRSGNLQKTIVIIQKPMEVLGIKIGHFYWAAANVAAPRTFAEDPADPGYWYFYNRSDEAWTSSGNGVPPVSIPGGSTYADPPAISEMWDIQNNNPCPAGWMVPTYSHLKDMLANSTKSSETGCRIFTDNVDPTQVLTMPLPGQMSSTGLSLPGSWANYAVVTPYPDNIMDTYRFFVAASSNELYSGGYADAGSVRCVRDDGARYELNVASDNASEGDGAATLSMFDRSGWAHTIPGLYFGAMAMIEATPEEGYVFDRWLVEEGSGGEFFLPTFPQTFVLMPWENTRVRATFAVTSDTDPGVQIGSTIWASSNLQTLHEFAPRPESPGQFFQFGRGKESYSVNDYGIVVSSSTGASFVVGTSDWDEGGVQLEDDDREPVPCRLEGADEGRIQRAEHLEHRHTYHA